MDDNMDRHQRFPERVGAALLGSVLLLSGCNNLFDFTAGTESYDALIADGREAIRAADYDLAVDKLADAVALAPERGEARYYFAKASVLAADVDVIDLVLTITDSNNENGAAIIFDSEAGVANRIYTVNQTVVSALNPIRVGDADLAGLTSTDVELDLAIAYTLRGILRLRDTNGDGIIDTNDLSIEDFGLNGDGDYDLDGIDNIPPEDLNDMIDDLNGLLDEGGDLIGDLGGGGIDEGELQDLIDELGGDLSAFYVNTGIPGNSGEGDNDGDGLTDEECLNNIDDDGDGLVDEDSRIFNCGP